MRGRVKGSKRTARHLYRVIGTGGRAVSAVGDMGSAANSHQRTGNGGPGAAPPNGRGSKGGAASPSPEPNVRTLGRLAPDTYTPAASFSRARLSPISMWSLFCWRVSAEDRVCF